MLKRWSSKPFANPILTLYASPTICTLTLKKELEVPSAKIRAERNLDSTELVIAFFVKSTSENFFCFSTVNPIGSQLLKNSNSFCSALSS